MTCGRVNTDIFESDDVKTVSSLSPNNKPEIFANHFELGCQTRLGHLFHFVWKILFNGHCVLWCRILGSLGNHDGDAEENVDKKFNFYFTYESRATMKSFDLFITVETIAKLNPETKRYI